MLVKLVDGTEQEVKLNFISGTKRNEIIDDATVFTQEGAKLGGIFKPGVLMNSVVKAVIPKELDIDLISIESFDEIFVKYEHLFNQDKKKDLILKEK